MPSRSILLFVVAAPLVVGCPMEFIPFTNPPGEGGRLTTTVTQEQITQGSIGLRELRAMGRQIFTTPFNKSDGYGDGPNVPGEDPTAFGSRPTLDGNGTFLRVNGLDAQSCLECHNMVSSATVPATYGIGGSGGSVANTLYRPTEIDVDDDDGDGNATFDGRFSNPPFLFGSGGIELLGKEMTKDLQALRAEAEANPGTDVDLLTKGVNFGTIRFEGGALDTSRVNGVDDDLVVRPFGRKGDKATVRAVALESMQFNFGMQPFEVVSNSDADGDGVANEIATGEISAVTAFLTLLEPPREEGAGEDVDAGRVLFQAVGCATCHIPTLQTESRVLSYSQPEDPADPDVAVFLRVNLARNPPSFREAPDAGLDIPLYADLKRHDMGPALADNTGREIDPYFTTARLWGVADSGPYMHDGRALTIGEAILMHGGEARSARDNYANLSGSEQKQLLAFLQTLRTPTNAGADLE